MKCLRFANRFVYSAFSYLITNADKALVESGSREGPALFFRPQGRCWRHNVAANAPPGTVEPAELPLLDLNEPRLVSPAGVAARVSSLLEPSLLHMGFRIVRVKVTAAAGCTIQIMLENAHGGMTIDECEAVNDAISPILDLEDPVSMAYRLEISSAGIDRPLVRVSDFERAIGHELRLEMRSPVAGRRRFKGLIGAVTLDNGRPMLALQRLDAKAGEEANVQLDLTDLVDARLVLTDVLIRASLRAAKSAVTDKPEKVKTAAPAMTKAARLKDTTPKNTGSKAKAKPATRN